MSRPRRGLTDANGFRAIKTLRKVAADPRVDEIEGAGMDDGRVFIHVTHGWRYDLGSGPQFTASVGSVDEIRWKMSRIYRYCEPDDIGIQ